LVTARSDQPARAAIGRLRARCCAGRRTRECVVRLPRSGRRIESSLAERQFVAAEPSRQPRRSFPEWGRGVVARLGKMRPPGKGPVRGTRRPIGPGAGGAECHARGVTATYFPCLRVSAIRAASG
jgi:hypothetical protein